MALTRRPRKRRSASGTGFSLTEQAFAAADLGREQAEGEALSLRAYGEKVPEPGVGKIRIDDDFPFHAGWFSDEVARAAKVVISKSAQVGASAFAWRYGVRLADLFGYRVTYWFPTADHVTEFSSDRVDPAIDASEYLSSRARGTRTKTLKQIGAGSIYFRGGNSKAGAQSIAAQARILDEYDLIDRRNLGQIARRTSGAAAIGKAPKELLLGYPYTPNDGIDAEFAKSDRRYWHVSCMECGEEQPLEWGINFRWTVPGQVDEHGEPLVFSAGNDNGWGEDPERVDRCWRACRECDASLEDTKDGVKDGAIRRGRWIVTNPEGTFIGFHAWRGMVPGTDLKQLVIASRGETAQDIEDFHILDLGEPWQEGQVALTDDDLAAAKQYGLEAPLEAYWGDNPVTAGVDVGDTRGKGIHVRIDEQLPLEPGQIFNRRRAIWQGVVHSWEDLAAKVEAFRVAVLVVDYNPEREKVRELQTWFPGRVILADFGPDKCPPLTLKNLPNGMPTEVTINRTDMLDGMIRAVRQLRAIPLKNPPKDWGEHLKRVRRVNERDSRDNPIARYITTGGKADDYAFADGYATVASQVLRSFQEAQVTIEEVQGTPIDDGLLGIRRTNLGVDGALHYEEPRD